MKHTRSVLLAGLLVLVLGGGWYVGVTTAANENGVANGLVHQEQNAPVCPGPAGQGTVRCHARVVVDQSGAPKAAPMPAGYGPADFHGAYTSITSVPTTATKQIIGIVDAYDDPNIVADLATYNSTFGIQSLPTCAGSVTASAVPCFQKVNQRGGTSAPTANAGWALEISLDVEAAHAMCQNCSILLVEADSNSFANLMAAVDRAAALGATEISNSYGGSEFSGETAYDSHFNLPGRAITVSSGDAGYGVEYPAASQYVTAVGGTTLTLTGSKTWNGESAWSGAGSGCSAYEPKPIWQANLNLTGCATRTVADVSADADPSTGAAVYDSVRYQGRAGWFKVGGTSLSSPLLAGMYALAGGVKSGGAGNSLPYATGSYTTNLHDVTTGSNGSCGSSYLCTALTGYDGPTGLGTPKGTGAF